MANTLFVHTTVLDKRVRAIKKKIEKVKKLEEEVAAGRKVRRQQQQQQQQQHTHTRARARVRAHTHAHIHTHTHTYTRAHTNPHAHSRRLFERSAALTTIQPPKKSKGGVINTKTVSDDRRITKPVSTDVSISSEPWPAARRAGTRL